MSLRITTWNVNGLRAALRKGFGDHLAQLAPDVVMLQEVRALTEQLPDAWVDPVGWQAEWHAAERKGYSGVATWSRHDQERLGVGIGDEDAEGRVLQTRSQGVRFVNTYLPSGSSKEERQRIKDEWLVRFLPWAQPLADSDEPVVLAGDLNIAHTENDIHNPGGNKKTSGFLPHEREWFGEFLASGWRDVVREHFGDRKGPYSWWSNRGRARELDRGWRIDYLLLNEAAAARFRTASIHRPGGLEVSDHAPVTIELA